MIAREAKQIDVVDELLTLEGLRIIFQRNRPHPASVKESMLNVGLTGGIASGKSTVARMLAEKGALLIDFDELAHAVEEPEGPVWREIVQPFRREILGADRTIDRRKLGAVVFADREKLELLNRLVHPAVFAEWRKTDRGDPRRRSRTPSSFPTSRCSSRRA